MVQGQELELALGMPIMLMDFVDGKPRMCHPFTIENLLTANMFLSIIDQHDLIKNFENQDKLDALIWILANSFNVDADGITDLIKAISVEDYEELIKDIKHVSGIKDTKKGNSPSNEDLPMTTNQAVTAIVNLTSLTYEDVRKLTPRQYESQVKFIDKLLSFEYKYSTIFSVKDPEEYLKPEDYPLVDIQEDDRDKPHKTTLANLEARGIKVPEGVKKKLNG